MIKIIKVLTKYGYIQDGLFYVPKDEKGLLFHENKFSFDDGFFLYYNDENLIFKITDTIDPVTVLVLLTEYGVINERYVYETLEGISEMYYNDEDENEDDE